MARIIQTADLTPQSIAALPEDDKEWIYNGLDCAVTHEVLSALRPNFDEVTSKTYDLSRSLQAPILEMSLRGVKVDLVRRDEVLVKLRANMRQVEDQLNTILSEGVGTSLNWRSPVQLKTLLYEVLGLPPVRKRTANGTFAPTANREALEQLSVNYFAEPICNHILALRDLDKKRQFLETGIDSDGCIRTSLNIAGTDTGRLASSESAFGTGTNLQNVDRDLRSVLIPDEGMKFGNLDLEQGDARNVGAICWNLFADEDEAKAGAYLDACESGDLHTTVCRMAYRDLPWTGDLKTDKKIAEQIAYRQDSYRQLAKKLGHGTNYFGTPPTMAKHSKVEKAAIVDFQQAYFEAFPAIGNADHSFRRDASGLIVPDNWHNYVRAQLYSTGTLTTLLGRRRRFWGRPNEDTTLRKAIAYEPQSLTADEIDIGLLKIWRANKVQLLIQVHDSILFQYPAHLEDEIIPWALETLKVYIELKRGRRFHVPTEAKIGWNWGDVQYDKEGKIVGNEYGLIKWTGGDDRKAPKRRTITSILDL